VAYEYEYVSYYWPGSSTIFESVSTFSRRILQTSAWDKRLLASHSSVVGLPIQDDHTVSTIWSHIWNHEARCLFPSCRLCRCLFHEHEVRWGLLFVSNCSPFLGRSK
jgi:hypothetical protein